MNMLWEYTAYIKNVIQYNLIFGNREDNNELIIYGHFNGENDDEPVGLGGFQFQTNPLHLGPPDEPFS